VCRFAALPAGATVYDACGAPGGKAVTLEAGGARRIIAGEVQRHRLTRLVDTVRRAGQRISVVAADVVAPPFAPDTFDAVLVDAPCTATGVIARHPDARWRLSQRAIARSAARQASLLQAAATLVRPGGILVYATCSLEAEENENIVSAFLEQRPEFRRAPAPQAVSSVLLTAAGDFRALPQRHGVDGAYAARLERAA
jgi:16S rRNA (cytosine967-C5)-methyltransferase